MDEQTADFFNPPEGDAPAVPPDGPPPEYAPMEGGYENIGDVDFAGAPSSSDSAEGQHNAPAVLVLDEPPSVPPAADDSGLMDFAAAAPAADDGGVIQLGAPPPAEGDPFGSPPTTDDDPFAAPPTETADPFAAPPTEPADPFGAPAPMGDASPPVDGAPVLVEPEETKSDEPTPMAKFNAEWQVILRERKDNENAVKAKFVEDARADLEAFQAQRETRREQRMAKNRADEQQKLEDLEADLENDNSWQRVNKMVELQQDTVEGARDNKRMIDVLILMKNDTERAVALS